MHYWLFKTEPDEFSIDDLAASAGGIACWDGIRNYQARNLLRDQVAVGDQVFIYHSSCKTVGIAGVAEVVKAAYADPNQFNPNHAQWDAKSSAASPRWFNVDLQFVEKFPRVYPLSSIKSDPALTSMVLVKQGRLSIQPVSPQEWQHVYRLASA